ncbi:hypothetical protein GCM10007071_25280 [Marinobacter zhanjiangensis]|uniref:Uncharacterized protein n=1 Tax=Marinobacter zhanjiangensis TaxID=578215 RepID=A0ABQ3B5L5_9GAMM|nr:hypothetical protein GCM10007071_25280 [Marinobacter zhanjiangensis]
MLFPSSVEGHAKAFMLGHDAFATPSCEPEARRLPPAPLQKTRPALTPCQAVSECRIPLGPVFDMLLR